MLNNINLYFVFSDFLDVTLALVINIAILLAIILIYSFLSYDFKSEKQSNRIGLGFLTGIAAILIMSTSYSPFQGLIIDTRSILFVIVGLHFGLTPSTIGGAIAILYRTYLGGEGVFIGVLTISLSISIGLIWRYFIAPLFENNKITETLVFSLFSQIIIFLLLVLGFDQFDFIIYLSASYLVLFPAVTILINYVLIKQGKTLILSRDNEKQVSLLTALYDSVSNMEMFAVDEAYNYIIFNKYHKDSMFNYYGVNIKEGINYSKIIENEKMKVRILNNLAKSLKGEVVFNVQEIETEANKFVEERYNPIYNANKIVGVTVFSNDISERIKNENSILYLSYHDHLTGLFNRRHFSTIIDQLNTTAYYPLSIIQSDIDGLKIINDAFGHNMGDELLSTVANAFKEVFNQNEPSFRIGGDEFLVILPNTPYEDAVEKIKKLKNLLYNVQIKGINLSLSYGVQTITDETLSLERALKDSEDKMYKNKLRNTRTNRYNLIEKIMNALNEKNPVSKTHMLRVRNLAALIGKKLKLDDSQLNHLSEVSRLHDIGKIAISSDILNKVEPLTEDEWAEIKRHPEIGYRIISTSPEHINIAYDILSHHERYDGKGYPQGLVGNEIPYKARIISVADAIDAMMSDRPYRKPKSFDEAIQELNKHSGTQFDPEIIKVINENIEEFKRLIDHRV